MRLAMSLVEAIQVHTEIRFTTSGKPCATLDTVSFGGLHLALSFHDRECH